MFSIVGECLFVGDKQIANGMRLENDLREMGFYTTPTQCCANITNRATLDKRWGFTFGCGTNNTLVK